MIVLTGSILYPAVAAGLWAWTPLGALDARVVAGLLQLLPFLAAAQLRQLPLGDLPRVQVYASSAMAIVVVGGIALTVGLMRGGWEAVGLGPVPWGAVAVWSASIALGALALAPPAVWVRRAMGVKETPFLRQLLPKTRTEKGWFAVLSLAAGFGEEIAYRGYAINVLVLAFGSVPVAVLLSSVAFGALHTYQGFIGIVRTGALGAVLAGVFLASGSLWPAIAVHASLDLLAGLVVGDRFLD